MIEMRQDIAIEMALPLTTNNEIRCILRAGSCTSSLVDTMRLPRLRRKPNVEWPNTQDGSTAIG